MKTYLKTIFAAPLLAAAIMFPLSGGARTKVVAHRGFWTTPGSAQNSLAGLQKADSIGVDAVEFDVWRTSDGVFVVDHDRHFKGVDLPLSPAAESLAIVLDNGELLPSLNEFLSAAQRYPATGLVLELKSIGDDAADAEAAARLKEVVEFFGIAPRLDFISFSLAACNEFHRQMPDVPVYYLGGELAPKTIKSLGFAGIDYSMGALRKHPEWIKEAKDLGLKVNVWTVDKDSDMKEFLDQDVDFITTNQPVVLQTLLKKEGK